MIGIFFIYVISKEINMGGNVFVPRGNIIGISSMDAYHIVLKSGVINLAALKVLSRFSRTSSNIF